MQGDKLDLNKIERLNPHCNSPNHS